MAHSIVLRPNNKSLKLLICCTALLWGTEAQSSPLPTINGSSKASNLIPQLWNFDQIVAQVPGDQARIGAVAAAKTNIALRKAKRSAERQLCAGRWIPLGHPVQDAGSVRRLPDSDTWQYQSIRQSPHFPCGKVSRTQFFIEMSRHLPEWISIRPAGQLTAYRGGKAVLLSAETMTARR